MSGISIYTDASFHPGLGTAGWGVWVRSSGIRALAGGPAPIWVRDPNEAELYAACAGIWVACEVGNATEGDVVHLRSDNQSAVRWLDPAAKAPPYVETGRILEEVRATLSRRGLLICPRWVKGHLPGDQAAAYLNRRVDDAAKRGRMEAQAWIWVQRLKTGYCRTRKLEHLPFLRDVSLG